MLCRCFNDPFCLSGTSELSPLLVSGFGLRLQWIHAAFSGLCGVVFTSKVTPPSPAAHLREDLLTPRFYSTENAKAARTDLSLQRPAFEAMLTEMEADYNRDHFDRKAPLGRFRPLNSEQKVAYESYLVRSCVSEFSGFLLFKELSRQLKVSGRQELSRLFSLMARDEARHAGFINRALLAEGIELDLPALSGKRPVTWFPLSWVLYSVYLSEKIGYWRYILIHRHLLANPKHSFAPLFDFFEPWCQDENRHGDIFKMLISCWPELTSGLRGRLLSRFFLWSVFLTHSLTVCERGDFYQLLGIDSQRFDAEVLQQTNRTARRAFPVVFDLEDSNFMRLRNDLVSLFTALRFRSKQPLSVGRVMRSSVLRLRFGWVLLRQFFQPMQAVDGGIA